MEKAYAQGFIDKCAQYGVDPEVLVKAAAEPVPEGVERVMPGKGIGNTVAGAFKRFGAKPAAPAATNAPAAAPKAHSVFGDTARTPEALGKWVAGGTQSARPYFRNEARKYLDAGK